MTCPLVDEADALPLLTATQRRDMRTRFTIAPEKLRGPDADGVAMLRRYDRWMGTSWDRNYALPIGGRYFEGEEPNSTKTSLFSLFRRGGPFPGNDPGTMTWREYGDIQWAEGMSALHYDWLRAPFKHYLRTGNLDALRWAMAAARHTVAVDHTWESPVTPEENTGYKAGYSRYEKGDHGTYDLAKASHTWVEGLFIAAAVTGDPWIMEAAVDRAEAAWRQGASTNTCGETRFNTWPLLTLVTAWRETGDVKYWNKAKLFVEAFWQEEQDTGAAYGFPGGLGYATHRCGWGNQNNAGSLMNAYAVKPLMAFAEEAEARGQGEMLPKYVAFYTRIATWLTTPVPNGALVPPNVSTPWMKYAYYFCPVGVSCTYPTDTTGSVEYNNMISDLFFWLAMRDPNGRNPNTNELWSDLARNIFRDALNYSALPDPNQLGLLTTMYPSTETKALGWPQLFNDRAAMWFAHWWPTLNREGGTSRAVDEDRQEGESTTKEEVDARKGGTSRE